MSILILLLKKQLYLLDYLNLGKKQNLLQYHQLVVQQQKLQLFLL